MFRQLSLTVAVILLAFPAAAQNSANVFSIEPYICADSTLDVGAILASGHSGRIDLDGYRFKMMPDGPKLCSVQTGPASGCMAPVKCAAVYDGMVVFGGMFGRAGSSQSSNIVGYDGATWVSLGRFGVNRTVFALEIYDGRLIAAGEFNEAGGDRITYVAAWDGQFWSPLGDGLSNVVFDLAVFDGRLVAAGDIAMASSHGGNSLVAWNGSRWEALASADFGYIYALNVINDQLFATGKFIGPDGRSDDRIIEVSSSSLIADADQSSPDQRRYTMSFHAELKDK